MYLACSKTVETRETTRNPWEKFRQRSKAALDSIIPTAVLTRIRFKGSTGLLLPNLSLRQEALLYLKRPVVGSRPKNAKENIRKYPRFLCEGSIGPQAYVSA